MANPVFLKVTTNAGTRSEQIQYLPTDEREQVDGWISAWLDEWFLEDSRPLTMEPEIGMTRLQFNALPVAGQTLRPGTAPTRAAGTKAGR